MPKFRADIQMIATIETEAATAGEALAIFHRYAGSGQPIDLTPFAPDGIFDLSDDENEEIVGLRAEITCRTTGLMDFERVATDRGPSPACVPGEKLTVGNFEITLEAIGEGYNGDYDPDDEADRSLLRLDVSREGDDDNGSCVTTIEETAPIADRQMALERVASALKEAIDATGEDQVSLRHFVERIADSLGPAHPAGGSSIKGISKTVLEVTVLHRSDDADRLARMSLEQIGNEIDDGAMIGSFRTLDTSPIPPRLVVRESVAIGSDGTFFEPED